MATGTETRTVVGVFNSVHDAQEAVRELEARGLTRDDISIVANKNAVGYDTMDSADRDKAADVVADAGIGAAIGGVGGLLLSAAGALTIPVIGPILAAGPIAAALTGAGIGAAAGGLIGALTESGIPEEDARHYAEGVRRGDVLVTVKADTARADEVCDILDRNRAVDVDDRVRNWRERGWSGYSDDAQPFSDDDLRTERSYYQTRGTLTGESGIGVDRERSRLDRDDYDPASSGTVSTTGMTGAGMTGAGFTGAGTTDAGMAGTGAGTTGTGTGAGSVMSGAGHSTPGLTTSDRYDADAGTSTDRSMTERAGDKIREWKEDVQRTAGDLRDEARQNQHTMDRDTSTTRDATHGSTQLGVNEAARDAERERRRRSRVYDRTWI